MRIFGSISELVDLAFRLAGGKQVKLKSLSQSTGGNLVTVNVPDVAGTGDTQSMVLTAATQTISNKTLSSPTVSGGTINNAVIGGSVPAAGTFTDIVGSTLDINTSAELQTLTIPSLSTAGVLHNNASGVVSSSKIVDGDVDNSAGIAFNKLATLNQNSILLGNSTNKAAARPVTGDISVSDDGTNAVTAIAAGVIVDADINNNAAITRSKLATGNQYRILANNSLGVLSENAALTPSEAVATDANGQLVTVTGVSSTELGYLSGVTSDVQTQLTNKQPLDATLTAMAGVTTGADKLIYFTGVDAAADTAITSSARGLLDDASYADMRSTLGLGSMATQPSSGVSITGGDIDGVNFNRLQVEAASAAISSATLTLTKGIMSISSGENTLSTLSGLASDGILLTLINNEGADVVVNNSGNIQTGTGSDFTLKNGAAASFVYSSSLTKWVLAGGASSNGGGGLTPSPLATTLSPAVSGVHYLTNTSSAGFTVTLPAGASGSIIRFSDANETWDLNQLTIAPASGEKIDNLATNESLVCDVKRGWVELSWNTALSSWSIQSISATNVVTASATQAGIVSTGAQTFAGVKTFQDGASIKGATSGSAVAAGYIGEKITWAVAPVNQSLTTTLSDWTNANIALTPGVWQIFASAAASAITGASVNNIVVTILRLTDNANNLIDNQERQIAFTSPAAAVGGVNGVITLSTVVNISSNTTYKLRAYYSQQSGAGGSATLFNTATAYATFYAVRIA